MARYIALVKEIHVNAQLRTRGTWKKADLPLYIGKVEAATPDRARELAASMIDVDEGVIQLNPLE